MKTIVALSYFHRKIGPLEFYSYPKNMLDKNVSEKITNIMDQQSSEGFFTHTFKNLKSMNYYFEIHSEWAPQNKEMLMISVILDQPIPPEIEEKISILCGEFSEVIQGNEESFTGFYINDINKFIDKDQERIEKTYYLIKAWIHNLYWAIIEETREEIEEEKINLLLDDQYIFESSEKLTLRPIYNKYLKRLKNIKTLADIALKKINYLMKKESVNELTINRKYLQEIFDADLLEISKNDGFPTLKPFVLEYFSSKRILTEIYGNVIKFKKLKKN